MKTLLFLLTCIISLPLAAQDDAHLPIDSITHKVAYSEIQEVDSLGKAELYTRAKEWFATTYNSANAVIQMDDKEAGKIVGKGIAMVTMNSIAIESPMNYTISVYLKDGKYKVEVKNISYSSGSVAYPWSYTAEEWEALSGRKTMRARIINQTNSYVHALFASLEAAMTKPQTDSDGF